mgnify:CR=1 FL=1
MRILIIAATYPPTRCGVGDYVRRVGHEFVGEANEIFVLTGASEDEDHDHGDPTVAAVGPRPKPRKGIEVRFEADGSGVKLARAVETWDWSALDAIESALRDVAPDVVNLQYHGEDYLLHPAICLTPDLARMHDVPTVTTLHNLQQPLRWEEDGEDPLDHLMRASAAWICTNQIDEARLRAHDASPGRLHRVPTGPSFDVEPTPRVVAPDGPLRVGYFGFLNPFKGIEFLLRAVAGVRDRGTAIELEMGAGIHTDAPGRLRDYAAAIDAEIEELALGPNLHRQGFLPEEEIGRLLSRCHVAVFPFREGLSGKNTSFWSTMHQATPTLTTRGPGLPDGLVDGENTLLAPVEDVDALIEKLLWADAHRDVLEEIGRKGQDFVVRSLSWDALAARMLEIFDRSTAGRLA